MKLSLSSIALAFIALYTSSAVLTCHWSTGTTPGSTEAEDRRAALGHPLSSNELKEHGAEVPDAALRHPLSSRELAERSIEESSLFWDRQLEVSGSGSGSYGGGRPVGGTNQGGKKANGRDRWAKFKAAAKFCMAEKGKCSHWRGSRFGVPMCSADGTIDECVLNKVTAGMLLLSDAYTCGECAST